MTNLSWIYRNQGRFEKAEQLHIKGLNIRKRVLGEEHLETLLSKANLASIYRDQGRWAEAEELEEEVTEARKSSSTPHASRASLSVNHWLPKVFEQSHPTTAFHDIDSLSASFRWDCNRMLIAF